MLNGEMRAVTSGIVSVRRAFAVGDEVVLTLPMVARWTTPDPRIDALRGQRAVERGPVVMCLESTDVASAGSVDEVRATGELRDVDGVVTVDVRRMVTLEHSWPYGLSVAEVLPETESVQLVPYHSWANRGPSSMRVWLPIVGDTVAS